MSARKRGDKWFADFYDLEGNRIRKFGFATKGEALRYEKEEKKRFLSNDSLNELIVQEKASQPLSELIELWFNLHGRTLSDANARLSKLQNLCANLGDPDANSIKRETWASYRKARLEGKFNFGSRTPKEATVNREHSYLRAVFNELKRLGHWDLDNPLDGIRLFKEAERELAFLNVDEIKRLLSECDKSRNTDLGLIVRICLATGARWGEAESLKRSNISPNKITFTNTKGKRNRTVPISEKLYQMLPVHSGNFFGNSYSAINGFRDAIERTDIYLPDGQLTHVLRHTFASHFMMNGGNILILQQILGHTSITTTMRYAHFAPDHLEAAIQLNPFDKL